MTAEAARINAATAALRAAPVARAVCAHCERVATSVDELVSWLTIDVGAGRERWGLDKPACSTACAHELVRVIHRDVL